MPHGKISYLEIPATDVEASAGFYQRIFGWTIRARGDGQTAFDDTTGQVSGAWVVGRPAAREPGVLTYVRVDDVEAALEKIVDAGGEIDTPVTAQGAGEAFATFRDPAGNVFGVFQEPAG